jgi:hypothetical protein
MTERKSFKRRVRARMEKTGERYTAARRQLIELDPEPEIAPAQQRTSDEALARNTGRPWAEWFAILDGWRATEKTHTEIARHLSEEHGVPGWWAQTVTVGYEQARGLREKHQRPEGFSVGVSKTVGVPVERLFATVCEPEERERWLPRSPLRQRTVLPPRSARFDWEDGRTRVVFYFAAKGDARSTVTVQHERLADADEAEHAKTDWRGRLAELKNVLEGGA